MATLYSEACESRRMDEIYEGRRKLPRVELETVMMVRTATGNLLPTMMRNISMDGAQINCNKDTAKLILEKTEDLAAKQPPHIHGSFELPMDGDLVKVEMECRIYYVASHDTESVSFGVLFNQDQPGARIIDRYIMKVMENYHSGLADE